MFELLKIIQYNIDVSVRNVIGNTTITIYKNKLAVMNIKDINTITNAYS